MSRTLRVVLTQSDKDRLRALEQSVRAEKLYKIVGITQNGREAMRIILEKKPDIVVLDAILPEMDGFCILKQLLENTTTLPIIFFLSHIYNETVVQEAVDCGVYYYMAKPYRMDSLMSQMRLALYNSDARNPIPAVNAEYGDAASITFTLRDIGIPANLRGYSYLREAILYVLAHEEALNRITKDLYPKIAAQFQTTTSRLERDMRHAITCAWNRSSSAVMQKYFGASIHYRENCISNGEFIATLAAYINAGMDTAEQRKTEKLQHS